MNTERRSTPIRRVPTGLTAAIAASAVSGAASRRDHAPVMLDLGTLPGYPGSRAFAINSDGRIAGEPTPVMDRHTR